MRRRLFRAPVFAQPVRTRLRLVGLEDRTTPAPFEVTSAADSGAGTLREALDKAAANAETDEIRFSFGILGQDLVLTTPLNVTEPNGVTVTPNGRTIITGKGASQLLTVAAGAKATFETFIFSDGKGADGGAINNAGTLTLQNCTLQDNAATGNGGAVFNSGTLTLTGTDLLAGCEVSNNTAGGNGGGLANTGTLVLNRSTVGAVIGLGGAAVAGNTAGGTGGGLFNAAGGKLFVVNSTVNKNTAGGFGGGLENAGSALLTSSTVAFNTGGGADTAVGGATTANNSLFVLNTGGDLIGADLTTSRFNLVGDAGSAGGLTAADNNIVGVAAPADVLDALDQEGGVSSYPLKAASPAIDKGSTALAVDADGKALTADQTNTPNRRVQPAGGTVDIGAREFVVLPPFSYGEDGTPIATQKNQPATLTGLLINTTYTDPTTVTLAVNDGTLTFSNPLPGGVSGVTGSGTNTLTFTADKGALLGGAGGGITFTPSADAVYDAAAGKKLTITLANGTNPVVTFGNPLVVTGPAGADPVASFTVAASSESEGQSKDVVVTVTLDKPAPDTLFVQIAFSGTATLNDPATNPAVFDYTVTDFQIAPFTVQIAKGATTGTLALRLTDDKLAEPTETAVLTIDPGSAGVTVGAKNTFTLSITDNDTPAPADTAAPTAKLGTATAGAGGVYTITVVYADNVAVNGGSLDGTDVRVTSPAGFSQLATFVSAAPTGNGPAVTATYKVTVPTTAATFTVALEANQVLDTAGNKAAAGTLGTFAVTAPAANPRLVGAQQFAVGTDRGGDGSVRFFNADNSSRLANPVQPFGSFTGGVRTAAADFNGDGVADVVVGTGPGRATRVVVLDGVTQKELFGVDPFESTFTGGVFVAAGDLTGDGKAELVVTPDEGGGPVVAVFGSTGPQLARFFGIDDANFRGGARAAVGDLDGDGKADLVVAAGFGGGPRVAGYSGAGLKAEGAPPKLFGDFFAFEQSLRNGTFVAAGDTDGDGKAEVIAGGGPGGGPRVSTFALSDLAASRFDNRLANFFAGDPNSRGGVRLAVKNLDGDNKADILAGAGTGAGSRVVGFTGRAIAANSGAPAETGGFDAAGGFSGGVFVG